MYWAENAGTGSRDMKVSETDKGPQETLNQSIPAWQWAVVAGFIIVSLLFVPDVRNSALIQSTWTAICAPFVGD